MHKGCAWTVGLGRNDVADLYLVVRDNDAVDEQFYKLLALSKGRCFQDRLCLRAKSLHGGKEFRQCFPLLGGRI